MYNTDRMHKLDTTLLEMFMFTTFHAPLTGHCTHPSRENRRASNEHFGNYAVRVTIVSVGLIDRFPNLCNNKRHNTYIAPQAATAAAVALYVTG